MTLLKLNAVWIAISILAMNNTVAAQWGESSASVSVDKQLDYCRDSKSGLEVLANNEYLFSSFNHNEFIAFNTSSESRNPAHGSTRRTPKKTLRDAYFLQGNLEIGVSAGTFHVVSDLAGAKELSLQEFLDFHSNNFDLWTGLFVRYVMNDWFALRFTGGYSSITIDARNTVVNIAPNIAKAENTIFELSGRTEFMIPLLAHTPFDVYGFTGIGLFTSNARLYDTTGRRIFDGIRYTTLHPFIPIGFGFDAQLTERLKIGYEFGWRAFHFNQIDGIEVEGYRYDKYFVNQLNLILRF